MVHVASMLVGKNEIPEHSMRSQKYDFELCHVFFPKKCWKIHIVHVALHINLMGFRKKHMPNFTISFFSYMYMYTVTTKFSLLFVRLRVVSLFLENSGKNRNQALNGDCDRDGAAASSTLVLCSSPRISEENRECSQCTFLFSLFDMQASAVFNHESLISPKLLTID